MLQVELLVFIFAEKLPGFVPGQRFFFMNESSTFRNGFVYPTAAPPGVNPGFLRGTDLKFMQPLDKRPRMR